MPKSSSVYIVVLDLHRLEAPYDKLKEWLDCAEAVELSHEVFMVPSSYEAAQLESMVRRFIDPSDGLSVFRLAPEYAGVSAKGLKLLKRWLPRISG
jgi:hypothetical protein